MSEPTIYEAARSGDIERMATYIAKGGNFKEPDPRGMTLLHFACFGNGDANNRKVLKLLLAQEGIKLEEVDNGDEWTPLHAAAKSGNEAAVEELMSMGVNPNARDTMGRTPLHLASVCFRTEVVPAVIRRLLAGGASKNVKSRVGLTAGEAAKANNASREILEALGVAAVDEEASHSSGKKEEADKRPANKAVAAAAAAAASSDEKKVVAPLSPEQQQQVLQAIVAAVNNNNNNNNNASSGNIKNKQ